MFKEDSEKLKLRIKKWADQREEADAIFSLVKAGLSYSLSRQLVLGIYKSAPKTRVAVAIRKAMGETK